MLALLIGFLASLVFGFFTEPKEDEAELPDEEDELPREGASEEDAQHWEHKAFNTNADDVPTPPTPSSCASRN